MTIPLHIQDRIEELREEIVELSAARNVKHSSGSEKMKYDKRIQRLWEIRHKLLALTVRTSTAPLTLSKRPARDTNYSQMRYSALRSYRLSHRTIKESDNRNRNQEVRPPFNGTPAEMCGLADLQHLGLQSE